VVSGDRETGRQAAPLGRSAARALCCGMAVRVRQRGCSGARRGDVGAESGLENGCRHSGDLRGRRER
jgi:hypothetical protein